MTQKEKIIKANLMAMSIKSIANRLERDARDYDVQFPQAYARELIKLAEQFLEK